MRDALLKYSTAAWLLLCSALSSALGLGQIEHQSWLGEPLQANIEIIDNSNKYRPEDFRLRQVYPEEAAALGVDVVTTGYVLRTQTSEHKGKVHVRISTDKPVFEPFLNFMLVLEWPDGKTYREYSLLLDPKGSSVSPAVSAKAGDSRPIGRAVAVNDANVVGKGASNKPYSGEVWTVRPAQTISQIAQRVRKDQQIQLQAVTNFLYNNNPQAFTGGMHQLLVGEQLKLPSEQDYAAMPRKSQARVKPVANRIAQVDARPEPKAQATTVDKAARVKYQVQPGDTLSQVAQKMRQNPNRRLQDVIDQLYRDNPEAFSGGKHGLKVGAELELKGVAAQSNAGLSFNQASSNTGSQAPDVDQLNAATDNSSMAAGEGRVRLDSGKITEDELLAGKLPPGSALPISQQIQMVAELTDKLNLENNELRQRIKQVENSDNIALLQQLVVLQAKQIDHFKTQLDQTMALLKQQNGSINNEGLAAIAGKAQQADKSEAVAIIDENLAGQNPGLDGDLESTAVDSANQDQTQQVGSSAANNTSDQPTPRTVAAPGQGDGTVAAKDSNAIQAAQEAGNRALSQASSQADSQILWMLIAAVAILCLSAILIDLRKEESWIRGRLAKKAPAQPAKEPELPEPSPQPAEPVVRVRPRETEEKPMQQEEILARPRPSNADKPFPGVARWSHRDIPKLDVEETIDEARQAEPLDEEETAINKAATEVNFDDFGLISLDDLDIDLEDGLDNAFDLDIEEIETQDSEKKNA